MYYPSSSGFSEVKEEKKERIGLLQKRGKGKKGIIFSSELEKYEKQGPFSKQMIRTIFLVLLWPKVNGLCD